MLELVSRYCFQCVIINCRLTLRPFNNMENNDRVVV